jgi:hypothetical protein
LHDVPSFSMKLEGEIKAFELASPAACFGAHKP